VIEDWEAAFIAAENAVVWLFAPWLAIWRLWR
jgi:hypothetical protein